MQTSPPGRQPLPPWERAGAMPLPEPAEGGLHYLAALEKWGRPDLVRKRRRAKSAVETSAASLVAAQAVAGQLAARFAGHPITRSPAVAQREAEALRALRARREADAAAALSAVEADFKPRWLAGEFVCFGFDPASERRGLIQTSIADSLNFKSEHPAARIVAGNSYQEVRFYRVADHPELAEPALIAQASAAPAEHPEVAEPQASAGRRFRGDKAKVWEAAQHRARPDFSDRGSLARYVEAIAKETDVKRDTVRNYVTKQTELRLDIENLPEQPASKRG
jgi:hypothetical protein